MVKPSFLSRRVSPANLAFDNLIVQWCNIIKVNFLKNIFGHRPPPDQLSSSACNWPGYSGKEYQFEIHDLNSAFQTLPGVYIYARLLPDGDWDPVYVAQTRDLHQRLEGHVRQDDAVANGATHLHAHYCGAGQGARCAEEKDLILRWRPVCNDVFTD